jgi:hypothetical protein
VQESSCAKKTNGMQIAGVHIPAARLSTTVRLAILLALAGVFFCSCAAFGVKKRRYMKGYFVECRHDRNPVRHITKSRPHDSHPAAGADQTAISKVEKVDPPVVAPVHGGAERDHTNFKVLAAGSADASSVHEGKPVKYLSDRNIIYPQALHQLKDLKQLSRAGEMKGLIRAAFSLMWIAVVVLLILYILGLLIGDFGPIIHALPVVAVVVLVLWLLKII